MTALQYYLAYSRAHYDKRWEYTPRHVVAREQAPRRGATGTSLCGVREVTVSDTSYPTGTYTRICKRCLRAHAAAERVQP